jgi:hypothetical protein
VHAPFHLCRDSEAAFTFVVNFMVPGPPFRNLVMSWASAAPPPGWAHPASTVSGGPLRLQDACCCCSFAVPLREVLMLLPHLSALLSVQHHIPPCDRLSLPAHLPSSLCDLLALQASRQTRRRCSATPARPPCATAAAVAARTASTCPAAAASPRRPRPASATMTTATATSSLPSTPASQGDVLEHHNEYTSHACVVPKCASKGRPGAVPALVASKSRARSPQVPVVPLLAGGAGQSG